MPTMQNDTTVPSDRSKPLNIVVQSVNENAGHTDSASHFVSESAGASSRCNVTVEHANTPNSACHMKRYDEMRILTAMKLGSIDKEIQDAFSSFYAHTLLS